MSTTAANVAALPKTDNTGLTPKIARQLYDKLGRGQISVVEFLSDERKENVDGSLGVKLVIKSIEPADDKDTEEYLRELQRALYRKRNPQPALTTKDRTEPTVDQVLGDGGELQLRCPACEHKYIDKGIAHTRNTSEDDGYIPCSWRACAHIVDATATTCQREHAGELHLV